MIMAVCVISLKVKRQKPHLQATFLTFFQVKVGKSVDSVAIRLIRHSYSSVEITTSYLWHRLVRGSQFVENLG